MVEACRLDVGVEHGSAVRERSRCRAASCRRDRRAPPTGWRGRRAPARWCGSRCSAPAAASRGWCSARASPASSRSAARAPSSAGCLRALLAELGEQFALRHQLSGAGHVVRHRQSDGRDRARRLWNEASSEKIAWPCWMAVTRRVVKEPPSRMPLDLVDDRHVGVARPHEIAVQRMDMAVGSTVRCAATSAWPMTWPPNTRCQSTLGLRPRYRLCSSCSRSRMPRSSSMAAVMFAPSGR